MSKAAEEIKLGPVNPKTGRTWRLTDAEIAKKLNAFEATLTDKNKALKYLVSNGFLTKTGRTPKKYGG